MPPLRPLLLAAAVFATAAVAGASTCSAQTVYDAANSFSTTGVNPNGAFSAGHTTLQVTNFALYDTFTTTAGNVAGFDAFYNSASPNDAYFKNTTAAVHFGTAPGQVALEPVPNSLADLRFTAPAAGSYTVAVQFFAGDVGVTDDYLGKTVNGAFSVLFHDPNADSGTNVNTFSSTVVLGQGDFLEVLMSNGSDGSNADVTPFSLTITPIPEPSAWALMFAGLGVLAGVQRLRRRA